MTGAAPVKVTLPVRALRTATGRILIYDGTAGVFVPVAGVDVVVNELSRQSRTGQSGRYLFRDLPPGTFTISVTYDGRTLNQILKVPDGPSQQPDVDFTVGRRE